MRVLRRRNFCPGAAFIAAEHYLDSWSDHREGNRAGAAEGGSTVEKRKLTLKFQGDAFLALSPPISLSAIDESANVQPQDTNLKIPLGYVT